MPALEAKTKKPRINIFKIGGSYYFKHFFEDRELFRELEPYYERDRYRFKMKNVGERNKIMKILELRGFDPVLIEDPTPYTVRINRYGKHVELLKNSVDSQIVGDSMVLVMKDLSWAEQAKEVNIKQE